MGRGSVEESKLEQQLLLALVNVGSLAQQLLTLRQTQVQVPPHPAPPHSPEQSVPTTDPLNTAIPAPLTRSTRPGTWSRYDPVSRPIRFFSDHASQRLQERYGVMSGAVVATMAMISHQIKGTHHRGYEALALGRAATSQGQEGSLYAVDLFGRPGFVITSEEDLIITVLPREPMQLNNLTPPQQEDFEAFRDELARRNPR